MSDREELVKIMMQPRMSTNMSGDRQRAIASDILAAGYTKPREISTPEELEALPVGTVVRTTEKDLIGHVCVRYSVGWYTQLHGNQVFPLAVTGAVKVLYVPENVPHPACTAGSCGCS